jgi:hypothetical protein
MHGANAPSAHHDVKEALAMYKISRVMGTIHQALVFLRTLLGVAALLLILVGGYWVYHVWTEKLRYERYLYNVLGERRVAEMCVLQQERPADQPVQTTLRFQEFRESGDPLSPITLTLPGEEIYLDALVTVFDSEAVRAGEAKSLYLFRRIFTDRVPPRQGVALYRDAHAYDRIPQPYVHNTIERDIQRRVWERLWSLIEDPAYAEARRVRTYFGQAVYARLALGECSTVTLQNNGGLLLTNGTP